MRLPRRTGAALAAVLLAGTLPPGCGHEPPPRPPDVLLITIDTLRADALGCYGRASARTPNIDALAAGGARFANAFTPRGVTLPALTSINTGISPISHGVLGQAEALPAELPTLAETLGGAGWSTAAFITNICEVIVSLDDHIGRGYQARDCLRDHDLPQYEWDAHATDSAVNWMQTAPADKPALLWVHYMDPHGEHRPRPELIVGKPPRALLDHDDTKLFFAFERDDIMPPPETLAGLWQLYDAEIAGVDQQVGRLLEAWRSKRGNDTVIVLVADHGEEFFDHDNFMGHGDSLSDSVLHVPLIVSAPGRVEPGTVSDSIVELMDIAPTIVELVGQPPVPTHEGSSMLPALAPGGPPPELRPEFEAAFASRWRDVLTMRTSRWRYTWNLKFGKAEQDLIEEFKYRARFSYFRNEELLYDLDADPKAQHNLLADPQLDEAAALAHVGLQRELARWLSERMQQSSAQRSVGNEKLYDELMQLGYVEFVPQRYR